MAAYGQVFGCRRCWANHTLMRPASEKRQGTKSRWVGHLAVQQALWGFGRAGADPARRLVWADGAPRADSEGPQE